jgi:RNA polymerase sigma-70 factor (ECF subfamily)
MSDEGEIQMLSRFSRLWCEVESAVRVYFCGVIFNKSDVPDLVQRTAICAFRKFGQFDESQSFRAWVMGIACYEALGYIRDHARSRVVYNSEISEKVGEAMEAENETRHRREELLRRTMAELSDKERLMLQLHYHDGKPLAEVARRLGMAEGALRTALCRLRVKMREMILEMERKEEELP